MRIKKAFRSFLNVNLARHAAIMAVLALSSLLTLGAGEALAGKLTPAEGQVASFDKHDKKQARYLEGELLVKYKQGVTKERKEKLHKKYGHKKLRSFKSISADHVRLKAGVSVEEAIKLYQANPEVEYAEPNYQYEFLATPDDPSFSSLWGLHKINAPAAWDFTTGSSDVVVAVLDSGVEYTHPDLAANIWPGIGYNPATGNNDPVDTYGHGTHVAGTIGAVGNNGTEVVGVNWDVDLLACKIGDTAPVPSYALSCLDFVREQKDLGVNIVATNNSWGGTGYSQTLYDAIAAQQDILFIAAAGNDTNNNDGTPVYPASYDLPNVISVAATDSSDRLALFSNYGKQSVTLGAPGEQVYSTYIGESYRNMFGTSMAAPHVTGLAALLKAQDPNRDWRAIKNLILSGATEVPALADSTVYGRRVDAYGSVSCTDSPLFMPLDLPAEIEPGTPALFRYVSINCAEAAGPVIAETSEGSSFELLDDGIAPDAAAGDGVFTADWTPTIASVLFTFTSPNGNQIRRLPALDIDTEVLPHGFLDNPYQYTVPLTGGLSPYGALSIISGVLPNGLSLDPFNLEIIGTPTVTGSFSVTLEVTDAEQTIIQKTLDLTVYAGGVLEERGLDWGTGTYAPYLATDSQNNLFGVAPNGANLLVNKYDPDGALIWSQSYLLPVNQYNPVARVDAEDNVMIMSASGYLIKYTGDGALVWGKQLVGYTSLADMNFDNTGNLRLIARASDYTWWVLTVDGVGNIISSWGLSVGTPMRLAVDSGDNILVALSDPNGNRNGNLVQKYDTAGALLWEATYDTSNYESPYGIGVDADDNVYAMGISSPYYPGFSYLLKYNSAGELSWTKTYTDFVVSGMVVDDSGTSILTGGLQNPTTHVQSMLTISYDQAGSLIWTSPYELGVFRNGKSPAIDDLGRLHVSALSSANVPSIVTYEFIFHIPTDTLTPASFGIPYSSRIPVVGGIQPLTWSLIGGTLPEGLVLDPATGIIAGTPTATGTSTFSLQASDASGAATSKVVSLTVHDPPSLPQTIPAAVQNVYYYQSLSQLLTGGLAPYTWELSGGALPTGMTLNTNTYGNLYGTPPEQGGFDFTVTVTDSLGASDTQTISLTVAEAVVITTTTLTNALNNQPYAQTLEASGGVPPYNWSVKTGYLPAGLTLDPSGTISGTPTTLRYNNFTLQAIDTVGVTAQQYYTVVVYNPLTISATPATSAQMNVVYNSSFKAVDGIPAYTWSVTEGVLPPGLTLNAATGAVTGSPTALGTFTSTVSLIDSMATTIETDLSITVDYIAASIQPSITPTYYGGSNLTTVNRPYTLGMTVSGGMPPFSWSLVGELPVGLVFDSATGTISGTPTEVGKKTVTVGATDATLAETIKVINLDILSDASLNKDWNTLYTPSGASLTSLTGVVRESAGNLYVAASVRSTSTSKDVVYLAKFNPAGGLLWTRTHQVASDKGAWPTKLTIDSNDAIYVSGVRQNTDGTISDFIIKYDTNGTLLTQLQLPSTSWSGFPFDVDGSGNIVTGSGSTVSKYSATGTLLFSTPMGNTVKAIASDPTGNIQVIWDNNLTKLDSNGVELWSTTLPATPRTISSKTDSNGNLYVAFVSWNDFRLCKYDPAGNLLWERRDFINSTNLSILNLDISSDRLAVSTVTMDWTGTNDALLLLYSTDGDLLGGLNEDGGGSEYAGGAVFDNTGNIYTATYGTGYSGQFSLTKFSFGLDIITIGLTTPVVGQPYTQILVGTGGIEPYTWTVIAGDLPPGLALDAATGILSGTPTSEGAYQFTVSISDGLGAQSAQDYTLDVIPALILATTDLPQAWLTKSYSFSLDISGGTAPYTATLSDGALPTGITLASTGLIKGTPTVEETATFTLQVSDQSGQTVSRAYTLIVDTPPPMYVTPVTAPQGVAGEPYTVSMPVSGGVPPYWWATVYNPLPPGLTLDSATGTISGVPTQVGSYYIISWIFDELNTRVTSAFYIHIESTLAFTGGTLPTAISGTPYNQSLVATDGVAPYSWSVSSLPTGLTLDAATGTIAGTPEEAGVFRFIASVVDSSGGVINAWCTIEVLLSLEVETTTLPFAVTETPYSQTLSAVGGTPPYSWNINGGTLPTGLTLDSASGEISGIPISPGTANFTAQVTDSLSGVATQDFSLTVVDPLVLTTSSNLLATTGIAYTKTLEATGGSSPYIWALSSGSLPAGLTLDSVNGLITGTLTTTGNYTFALTVSDDLATATTENFTFDVYDPLSIVTTGLPWGLTGSLYSQTLVASGGLAPYSWNISVGALPTGFTLDSASGEISGTLTSPETAGFTVQVTDSLSGVITQDISLILVDPLMVTAESDLLATTGVAFSKPLSANGGKLPYSWALTSGALPAGLTLDPVSGVIAGTPTTAGSYPFSVTVSDDLAVTATQNFTINVYDPLLITVSSLPWGLTGSAYAQPLTASGGLAPYSWAVTGGNLPAGLSLDAASGTISGTPTMVEDASFTVDVRDANGSTATQPQSISIYTPPSIAPQALAEGIFSFPYQHSMLATGGLQPYTWSISSGQLPNGLTLDSTSGAITGTPRSAGLFELTITVTDARQVATAQQYSLLVHDGTLKELWMAYDSEGPDEGGYDIAVDSQGNVYVAGTSGENCLAIKYDPNGNVIWRSVYASGSATGIAVDPQGNVYVNADSNDGTYTNLLVKLDAAGSLLWSQPHGDGLAAKGVALDVNGDAYVASTAINGYRVIRFDSAGDIVWDNIYAHTGSTYYAQGIATDQSGNVYVSGYFYNISEMDNLLIKVTPEGLLEWSRSDSLGSVDLGHGVTVDSQGDIHATGYSRSDRYKMTTRRYDPAGNLLWSGSYTDGERKSFAKDIAVDTDGNFYLCGVTINDNSLPQRSVLTIVKFDPAGNLIWVRSKELPTTTSGNGLGITLDKSGQIYVSGRIYVADTASYKLVTLKFQQFQIDTASLPLAITGVPYAEQLSTSGGTEPYTWSVVAGLLPDGLSLEGNTGLISGSASVTGNSSFTLRVTDALGVSVDKPFTIEGYDPLAIDLATLPVGIAGGSYSQTFTAQGGLEPYTWSANGLPNGLAIDSASGEISGTANLAGSYTVTVQVSDSAIGSVSEVVEVIILEDFDRDGYDETIDCDDQIGSIYPGAPEINGDGVDQDCNGYDLTISIISAEYKPLKAELLVRATSSYAEQAALEVEGFGTMSWDSKKNYWERVTQGVTQDPINVTVTGPEGAETANITIK